jgi:hypothetical protein
MEASSEKECSKKEHERDARRSERCTAAKIPLPTNNPTYSPRTTEASGDQPARAAKSFMKATKHSTDEMSMAL